MNREIKRRRAQGGYYMDHPNTESFTCKACGHLVTPEEAGTQHRNHCPNCLSSLHVDIEPGDRASDCGGVMEQLPYGCAITASGPLSTAANGAAPSAPTGCWQTTTP